MCVRVNLSMSDGTYSLKSIPIDRFLRNFITNLYIFRAFAFYVNVVKICCFYSLQTFFSVLKMFTQHHHFCILIIKRIYMLSSMQPLFRVYSSVGKFNIIILFSFQRISNMINAMLKVECNFSPS